MSEESVDQSEIYGNHTLTNERKSQQIYLQRSLTEPTHGGQLSMIVKLKRYFKMFIVVTCTLFLVLFILDSNQLVKSGSSDNVLPGNGFRKLLEDEPLVDEMGHTHNSYKKRLPQCIIVGVRKCGTRALLEFLNLHPALVAAEGEVHFFDDNEKYRQGLDFYQQRMPFTYPHQITIEKSPAYFITERVPGRIYKMNHSVRLIIIFRDPTTRVISDYTQVLANKHSKNRTMEEFKDLVFDSYSGKVNTRYKAVRISLYHHHLARWLEVFDREQIHIVDGDKLIYDPLEEIHKIEMFLGLKNKVTHHNLYYNVSRGFYCMRNSTGERCLGASKGRKHPYIDPKIITKLNDFFRPHNNLLFRMIGERFDWP